MNKTLRLFSDGNTGAYFTSDDTDMEMTRSAWIELGSPEQIVVSVSAVSVPSGEVVVGQRWQWSEDATVAEPGDKFVIVKPSPSWGDAFAILDDRGARFGEEYDGIVYRDEILEQAFRL